MNGNLRTVLGIAVIVVLTIVCWKLFAVVTPAGMFDGP